MLIRLLVIGLLLSVFLTSGCIESEEVTKSQIEEQALGDIEKEMEEATENIDLSDIENSITE